MLPVIHKLAEQSANPELFPYALGILYATAFILLGSVAYKFWLYGKMKRDVRLKKNVGVDTLSMIFVLALCFPFFIRSAGQVGMPVLLQDIYFGSGVFLCVCGTAWHLWSKISIGKFWSDQIEITQEHKLVTTGAYALARHPMYGSLVLWGWGAALMFQNVAAFGIITFIFLPMMIIRAKLEEKELKNVASDYTFYKENVRMLMPTISGNWALAVRVSGIVLLGYFIFKGITLPALFLLFFLHLVLGYMLKPENVAFSYRSKSGMMLVFYFLSLLYAPLYSFYWVIFAMFIYSLKWDCPCMKVYNKYHRCPCFALLGKCMIKKAPGKNPGAR